MINCFAGITGWTAPPILAAIEAAGDLTLTSGVSRSAAGQGGGSRCLAAEALSRRAGHVLVDFTSARPGGRQRAGRDRCRGARGHRHQRPDRLRLCRDRPAGARPRGRRDRGRKLRSSAALRRAATMAAEHIGAWEIIDYASDTKPDAPLLKCRDRRNAGPGRGACTPCRSPTWRRAGRGAGRGGGRDPGPLGAAAWVWPYRGGLRRTGSVSVLPGLTPAPYARGTARPAPGGRRGGRPPRAFDFPLLFED